MGIGIIEIVDDLPDYLYPGDLKRIAEGLRKELKVEEGTISVSYNDASFITFEIVRIVHDTVYLSYVGTAG